MKIIRVALHAVAVPQADPLALSAGGSIEAVPHVVVRLFTDAGIEGVGIAYRLSTTNVHPMLAACQRAAPAVRGLDPEEPETVRQAVLSTDEPSEELLMAASAYDIALWDIRAKDAGLPLYDLLGGRRDRVQTYASGDLWRETAPEAIRTAIGKHIDAGFRAVKMRIGGAPNASAEVARVDAARDAAGDDITILADVNQGWTPETAIDMADAMIPYRLGWIEDPVHHTDVDGLARVAEEVEVPICAGEHCFSADAAAELLDRKAVRVLMIDVQRVGGVTEWLKIAKMAAAQGVPVTSHLTPEVSVHLMAATPNGYLAEALPVSRSLFTEPLRVDHGELVAPERPGIGWELNELTLSRFAIS
jgi:L-alanine-DL-glutamate epimerase-like enolase superfamily enzyme